MPSCFRYVEDQPGCIWGLITLDKNDETKLGAPQEQCLCQVVHCFDEVICLFRIAVYLPFGIR